MRGAEAVVRALEEAGVRCLFSLSGNQIMPIFDAVLGTALQPGLVHVRHEAAAVHMADAYGRLQHTPGVRAPLTEVAINLLYTLKRLRIVWR